eukprot:6354500-Prymnesium_polylepis.1
MDRGLGIWGPRQVGILPCADSGCVPEEYRCFSRSEMPCLVEPRHRKERGGCTPRAARECSDACA